jgi:predicted O-methyltransferase YrrM
MAGDLIQSAWRGHQKFAEWLVRELKPKTIVELGVDYGFSSFVFARAGMGEVYGIDSFEGDPEAGQRNTRPIVEERQKELGVTNLHLVQGYFSEVAKTWDKPIDILHIDGRHRYDDVKEDYEIWSRFVRPGGVILLHDTCVTREPYGVHRFFREIELPKTNFTHSEGLGVVSTDQALIDRIRREHVMWLTTKSWWHFIQRVGRKLRKMAGAAPHPEF